MDNPIDIGLELEQDLFTFTIAEVQKRWGLPKDSVGDLLDIVRFGHDIVVLSYIGYVKVSTIKPGTIVHADDGDWYVKSHGDDNVYWNISKCKGFTYTGPADALVQAYNTGWERGYFA